MEKQYLLDEPVELPDLPLTKRWNGALVLALKWCYAASEMDQRGEYVVAGRYRDHAEEIYKNLEAQL